MCGLRMGRGLFSSGSARVYLNASRLHSSIPLPSSHTTHDPPARSQFVHVTGTKGKGTVCELVRCGLVAQGKRVGTFTR